MITAFQILNSLRPNAIKKLSLQQASKKLGLIEVLTHDELTILQDKISLIQSHIRYSNDVGKLQKELKSKSKLIEEQRNESDRLSRQIQDINKKIGRVQQINQRLQNENSDLTTNLTVQRRQVQRLNQSNNNRQQTINNLLRLQADSFQKFIWKDEFHVCTFIGLLSMAVSIALGWKNPNQPGADGLLASLIMIAVTGGILLLLIVVKNFKRLTSYWCPQPAPVLPP